MFSKTNSTSDREAQKMATSTPAARNSESSTISSNLHIVGNLKTDGEIQINGVIEGDVTAQALTVGNHARVSGEITGVDVVVHGHIDGKITAKNVRVAKTAKVVGDIFHEVLAIEAGAHIEGQLRRIDEAAKTRKAAPFNQAAAPKPAAGTNGKENAAAPAAAPASAAE
jgi:cytoskeletal protein CcmA (bactofilin family)